MSGDLDILLPNDVPPTWPPQWNSVVPWRKNQTTLLGIRNTVSFILNWHQGIYQIKILGDIVITRGIVLVLRWAEFQLFQPCNSKRELSDLCEISDNLFLKAPVAVVDVAPRGGGDGDGPIEGAGERKYDKDD